MRALRLAGRPRCLLPCARNRPTTKWCLACSAVVRARAVRTATCSRHPCARFVGPRLCGRVHAPRRKRDAQGAQSAAALSAATAERDAAVAARATLATAIHAAVEGSLDQHLSAHEECSTDLDIATAQLDSALRRNPLDAGMVSSALRDVMHLVGAGALAAAVERERSAAAGERSLLPRGGACHVGRRHLPSVPPSCSLAFAACIQ